MKLEKFDTKKKTKNYIIAGISVVLIAVIGVIIYKSYALYQEEKTFNVLQGKIGNFSGNDIEIAYTINGIKASSFPEKDSGYTVNIDCGDTATGVWDSENWGILITEANSEKISCSIDFSKMICKRATTLHTETCEGSCTFGCRQTIGLNEVARYGNLGTSGTLTTVDAFDCDVDGDGTYDAETERFYYVTDLESNKDVAVLIHYDDYNYDYNFDGYSDSPNYDGSGVNNNGPVYVLEKSALPSTTEWSNISLFNTTRTITNENGETTTAAGTLPTNFSYSGYAARLLTYQELVSACGSTNFATTCLFLAENTYYMTGTTKMGSTDQMLLETPLSSSSSNVWTLSTVDEGISLANNKSGGIRPVIEIPKGGIEY